MPHIVNRRGTALAASIGALLALIAGLVVATGGATRAATGSGAGASRGTTSLAAMRMAIGKACHSAAGKRTTIVLVHGDFAETSSWDGEVGLLTHAGCTVRAIANPLLGLYSDSQTVADFVRTIHGPVLLAGHSYGGSVITNAAAMVDNVVGLVYVDAAAPAVGETANEDSGAGSFLASRPPATLFDEVPYAGAPKGAVNMYLKKYPFINHFAEDLPPVQAEHLWAEQRAGSSLALTQKSKYAAWQTLPSWYFISTGDEIITPAAQKMQAARAHSHVTIFKGGSHISLVNHPYAVTLTIADALTGSAKS